MNQTTFERRYQETWGLLERDLLRAKKRDALLPSDFPLRYRQLCQQLALARQRCYDERLVNQLNDLALQCHQEIYGQRPPLAGRVWSYFAEQFPRLVRRRIGLFWLAWLLMALPAAVEIVASARFPEVAQRTLGSETMESLESMYDPAAEHFARSRAAESDAAAFGFYIWNNVSVALRTFAGGIFFGVGSVLVLLFNGLQIGAAWAYLAEIGYGQTFFPFIITHGSFELTAIVLSGMVGMEIGFALIAPGRRRRVDALAEAARGAAPVLYGIVAMLVLAAFIEAFWSPSTAVSATTKYRVGGSCWVLVFAYLMLAGRRRAD